MTRLSTLLVALSLCAVAQVSHATTWTPRVFATINAYPNGVITYIPQNGTIQRVQSYATPTTPSAYNTWAQTSTLASSGVTGVAPGSAIAGFGYLSPETGALIQRLFYQTTNGDIRSAFHSGINYAPDFVVDPTVIASDVPLGSPISAMQQYNAVLGAPEGIVVQWTDANGLLNSRYATTDDGGWNPSIIINTP